MRALALGLMLLALALGSSTCASREPLGVVEATLRLLNTATALRYLARLADTSRSDVFYVGAIWFVGGLGRPCGALTERRSRPRAARLTNTDEALHALAASTIQLLAIVVRG